MNDLLDAAISAWEQAADNTSSILVTALITNTILAAFEGVENRLNLSSNASDPTALLNKFNKLAASVGFATQEDGSPKPVVQQLLELLQSPWQHLLKIKDEGPAKQRQKSTLRIHLPSELVLRRGTDSEAADDECLRVMLQNIIQHIGSGYLGNNILRVGTPVYSEVGYFLTHDGPDHNGLRCSFGLQLLLASYKSYWFALSPDRATNCRLQALQLAQEALKSIDAVLKDSTMPCRCQGTLAYHLQNLREDFKGFLGVNRFDFFFQSPWVCGSHMLEMSDALFYYGLRLFSYRNYVGSVVHVYNVLRRFTDLESIPLLENLCTAFCDPLFPGGRPDRNYKACYIRFMGGRLRFNTHTSGHKSGCHSMAIPAHTAKATAGFGSRRQVSDPRFAYRKISCFYHIKEKGYHLDDAMWNQIYTLGHHATEETHKSMKTRSCSHHGHPADTPPSCSPHHRFECLHKAVLAEFTAPFPIARVNLLQAYLACVQILSRISDRYHGEDEKPGQNCLCFVDPLLSAGDRCQGYGNEFRPFGCQNLVRIVRDAMVETLGGREAEDFTWKGI